MRQNVRRDKDGRRIRTKEELEELKEYDVRGKKEAAEKAKVEGRKRRGSAAIGATAAAERKRGEDDATVLKGGSNTDALVDVIDNY